jgi:hypothetical protein
MAALGPLRVGASRGELRAYLTATARTVLAGYWRRRLGVQVTSIDPEVGVVYLEEPSAPSDAPAREMGITVANAKVLQHRALRMAANSGPPELGRSG